MSKLFSEALIKVILPPNDGNLISIWAIFSCIFLELVPKMISNQDCPLMVGSSIQRDS